MFPSSFYSKAYVPLVQLYANVVYDMHFGHLGNSAYDAKVYLEDSNTCRSMTRLLREDMESTARSVKTS